MCILKALSKTTSFKKFAETTDIPVYSSFDIGEIHYKSSESANEEYRISFDVSDKDFDEFPSQVDDAIAFLEKWGSAIAEFSAVFNPDEMFLSFPLYTRLNAEIANQNDFLPGRLIALAGSLGIGIEMSIYSLETQDLP